jgi:hypothetical protein
MHNAVVLFWVHSHGQVDTTMEKVTGIKVQAHILINRLQKALQCCNKLYQTSNLLETT